MPTIRLETRDGGFVAEKPILPFQLLPEVVLWGSRYFALHDGETTNGKTPVYREVFCYYIVDFQEERSSSEEAKPQ